MDFGGSELNIEGTFNFVVYWAFYAPYFMLEFPYQISWVF